MQLRTATNPPSSISVIRLDSKDNHLTNLGDKFGQVSCVFVPASWLLQPSVGLFVRDLTSLKPDNTSSWALPAEMKGSAGSSVHRYCRQMLCCCTSNAQLLQIQEMHNQ